MSFREIAVTIRAVNRASHEFSRIQTDAESLAVRIKSIGSAIAGIGASGAAIGMVAHEFGILNDQQSRVFSSAMMVVSVMGMFIRTNMGVQVAMKAYSAVAAVATFFQNTFNISFAAGLALTVVGIAAIAAATAAMWSYAASLNAATSSQNALNSAASETPARARAVQRSGEEAMYRKGVE